MLLRLPKDIADHPRRSVIEAFFTANTRPIREGSDIIVSSWPWCDPLKAALKISAGAGHLMQGLEQIEAVLRREAKGLNALRERSGQNPPPRMSRLLLVSADGTARFVRDLEELLRHHKDRAHACVMETTAAELGAYTEKGQPAKAMMFGERATLGWFLRNLADTL